MIETTRVAVDSNVIFSAVRTGKSRLNGFWSLGATDIRISRYVIDEVSRHLTTTEQRARLWRLTYHSHLIPDGGEIELPPEVRLPAQDRPILQAAIACGADKLVTSDFDHFAPLFGREIQGAGIEATIDFMHRYSGHFYPERGQA